MTLSQNTQSSSNEPAFFDEFREIQYRRLNELNKFVEYKRLSDSLIAAKDLKIAEMELVINRMEQAQKVYEENLIPSLESQLEKMKTSYESASKLHSNEMALKQAQIERVKRKRFGVGLYVGYGIIPDKPNYSAGIAFNYTFFRF